MAENDDKKKVSLRDLINDVNKAYCKDTGISIIKMASEAKGIQNVPRIQTGIFDLDYRMGGGLPMGRMTRIWGDESTGKSLIAYTCIAAAQKHCRICGKYVSAHTDKTACKISDFKPMRPLLFDAEGSFEASWVENFGVDLSNLAIMQPESAEQGIDVADAAIRDGVVELMVVDSIAALTPKIEIEESIEKQQMGVQARLINKAIRKWTSSINARGLDTPVKPTILLINQMRQKIGVMFGSPDTQPGGKGQNFAISIDIRTLNPKYYIDPQDKAPVYIDGKFTIKKNKVGLSRTEGSYRFYLRDHDGFFAGETDEIKTVFSHAMKCGVVDASGKKGVKVFGRTFDTQKKVKEEMDSDPNFLYEVRTATMDILLGVKNGGNTEVERKAAE